MLRIDPTSPEPASAQLHAQISAQVLAGDLRPGDRLPTVRRLAGDLGIAPNTVARAYRDLEADGMIEGRGRAGTFVAEKDAGAEARQAAAAYVRVVQQLGLAPTDALELVRHALRG
ncbi:GntR family transcriptional regulator [Ornithinimicrobium panacihumi]|uniref:GntR family transcriptional regulator n=1 Tax=Ornithinimicrobium panacihumi TaxID=2008449 RepID=UPI003F8A904C